MYLTWKFFGKIRTVFRKIDPQLLRFYLSNHRRNKWENSWGNTLVCRFLQGIWFYTLRKNETDTYVVFQNCYNDALQGHRGHYSLTWLWHWLLWHCHWSLSTRCIGTISIHNRFRLRITNINQPNERKWVHTNKRKEANDIP